MQPTEQRALEVAVAVAAAAGHAVDDAALLRSCNAVLVELPRAGVVARVELLGGASSSARMAAAARHFELRGAPTLRLLHAAGPVTIWPRLEAVGTIDARALGRLIRDVHERTRDPDDAALPRLEPFAEIARLLALIEGEARWPPEQLRELRGLEAQLFARWRELAQRDPLGEVLVHGDVHSDNVIVTADGPVLIDLELSGVGPASWDFVQLGAAVHRYGLAPAQLEAFIEGYGADPRSWPGYAVLRDSYELLGAAWAAAYRGRSPSFAREAQLRVGALLGHDERTWTLL